MLAVPFLMLSLWKRRVGEAFFITIMLLVYILYLSLVKYFITTLIPLDQVIFAYTSEEIIKIVLSSTRFDPIGIVIYFFLIVTPFLILFLTRKRKVGRPKGSKNRKRKVGRPRKGACSTRASKLRRKKGRGKLPPRVKSGKNKGQFKKR